MFTGIIEEIGKIAGVKRSGDNVFLEISSAVVLSDIALGKSIAVNGVCLTVVSFGKDTFTVEATKATLGSTNLKGLKNGSRVNLERAVPANGRFDGHFVLGHVDGLGRIESVKRTLSAITLMVRVDAKLSIYMVEKGSVAVDGVSLTIMGLKDDLLLLNIIPHTARETLFASMKTGDQVNIETDMLAKFALKSGSKKEVIDEGFLKENGYL